LGERGGKVRLDRTVAKNHRTMEVSAKKKDLKRSNGRQKTVGGKRKGVSQKRRRETMNVIIGSGPLGKKKKKKAEKRKEKNGYWQESQEKKTNQNNFSRRLNRFLGENLKEEGGNRIRWYSADRSRPVRTDVGGASTCLKNEGVKGTKRALPRGD